MFLQVRDENGSGGSGDKRSDSPRTADVETTRFTDSPGVSVSGGVMEAHRLWSGPSLRWGKSGHEVGWGRSGAQFW